MYVGEAKRKFAGGYRARGSGTLPQLHCISNPCKKDSHACSPAPWRRSEQLSLKQADESLALASMHRPLSAAQSGYKKLMAGELGHGVTPKRTDLKKYRKCCCNLTCGRVHTQPGLMRSEAAGEVICMTCV